jgi:hypothetical protein
MHIPLHIKTMQHAPHASGTIFCSAACVVCALEIVSPERKPCSGVARELQRSAKKQASLQQLRLVIKLILQVRISAATTDRNGGVSLHLIYTSLEYKKVVMRNFRNKRF